jgi:hypothetical protein
MLALDFGRNMSGLLHGARLGVHAAVGSMPRVRYAEQTQAAAYTAAGLSLSVGLGASE